MYIYHSSLERAGVEDPACIPLTKEVELADKPRCMKGFGGPTQLSRKHCDVQFLICTFYLGCYAYCWFRLLCCGKVAGTVVGTVGTSLIEVSTS